MALAMERGGATGAESSFACEPAEDVPDARLPEEDQVVTSSSNTTKKGLAQSGCSGGKDFAAGFSQQSRPIAVIPSRVAANHYLSDGSSPSRGSPPVNAAGSPLPGGSPATSTTSQSPSRRPSRKSLQGHEKVAKKATCLNNNGAAGRTPQTRRKEISLQLPINHDRGSPNGSPRNTSRVQAPYATTTKVQQQAQSGLAATTTGSGAGVQPPGGASSVGVNPSGLPGAPPHGPNKRIKKSSETGTHPDPQNARKSSINNGGTSRPAGRRRSSLQTATAETTNATSLGGSSIGNKAQQQQQQQGSKANLQLNAVGASELQQQQQQQTSCNQGEKTKFDQLWSVKTIEGGMIRIPAQMLDELIQKQGIEHFYNVDLQPVARYAYL